jgi:two-component system response regulator HydG
MSKILLIEDDKTFSQILQGFLKRQGHVTEAVHDIKSATIALQQNQYDLLLLDYRLPDGTGLDALAIARKNNLHAPAIIMTSFNDVRTAVNAMRSGAFDYITKPVNQEEFLLLVNEALHKKQTSTIDAAPTPLPDFIEGEDEAARKLQEHIRLVSPTDMSVMILGESGTGKEYIARSIHRLSKRGNKPFVAIDCGALSNELAASELFGHAKGSFTGALHDKKGQFEMANGGTLFLDEAGNLSYEVQVKLLRALQERIIQPIGSNKQVEVDVRIISATNDDLLNSVRNGNFREDLYHRLNEFKIQVPPLRMRGKDLHIFIDHFIKGANHDLDRHVQKLSPGIVEIFEAYDWPGNIRELKNVIRRMVLLSQGAEAGKETLPDEMLHTVNHRKQSTSSDLKVLQENIEKDLISKTLAQVKYNKSKAAKLLNIDRKTLYTKMERYGIE